MKLLVVLLATACYAAPSTNLMQVLPYATVNSGAIVAHADSLSPPVVRIPEPGINLGVQTPVQYSGPVQVATPLQYTAPVQVATPIQYTAPVQVATPVQYTAPVQVATPVQYTAPVQVATPVQYTAPVQVATPVQYTGAAPVMAAVPVVVAAAPEPLLAQDPPMPSVGVPHVGGQFHAQDEAGQYTFGHWGGSNTRIESRDFLGRTSGSFAYVDPEGDVQVRKYGSSPATGFRVAASDLPADTPAVAQLKSAHAQARKDIQNLAKNSAVTTA
ncbi:cuticle protein 21-like [Homarus americanus]|uniref:cuticle protein 21-like n=1 Tax=Homarus americanus TaxID=6706 RepID=UPI001C493182|nr:cuticle protein 21-like [Homarus americanus]